MKNEDRIALEVAIGYEVAKLLNIKFNKTTGKTPTTWGSKSVQGLGAIISIIVKEQTKRIEND